VEDDKKNKDGPSDDEKEAVRKRFAEIKTAKKKMLHPKEEIVQKKRKIEEERKQRLQEADERFMQELEQDPEKKKAWLEHRAKIDKIQKQEEEDRAFLKRQPSSWQEHGIQGIMYFRREMKQESIEAFLKAFSINPSDIMILGFLVLASANYDKWNFDMWKQKSQGKKIKLSKDLLAYEELKDRLFLRRVMLKDGWENENLGWISERFHLDAKMLSIFVDEITPSSRLIEIAQKLEKNDLKQSDSNYTLFLQYSEFLKMAGLLHGNSPEMYLTTAINIHQLQEMKKSMRRSLS
jgi:tetratricopeptide (TPR) repeat protein